MSPGGNGLGGLRRGSRVLVAAAAGIALGSWLAGPAREQEDVAPVLQMADTPARPDFERVGPVRRFVLPADHGPHFDYQTEWWYYTGQLDGPDGRGFGYQLTLFRRGLTPGPPPDGPGMTTNQVYFAHLAVTDVASGTHAGRERWSRGAAGLAGARAGPFQAWLEAWRIEALDADGSQVRVSARDADLGVELTLRATKPLVAHGEMGVSAKGDEPGNASYYVSYTRLASEGRLWIGGREWNVTGQSWFDHEWGTSALGPRAVGWDWFGLQLDDGRELMLFQIRRDDGGVEDVSGGTLVEVDGTPRRLGVSAVDLGVTRRWRSPETGAAYPAGWLLDVPSQGLHLSVEPLVADQEMRTSFAYWEGAVTVSGEAHGEPIGGRGYVELTGYAAPMRELF